MNRGMAKAERLRRLEYLLVLVAPEDGATTSELAEELKVGRHTVMRDIKELEDAGIPVQVDDNRYWIERMDYLSNVRVNVAESLMLYLAMRRAIRQTSYVPPIMVSALEKMTFALRQPVDNLLAASARTLHTERTADLERVQIWETLVRAWVEQTTVRVVYHSLWRDDPNIFEFQPYLFEPVVLSDGVYVVGFSLTHQSLRTLKVERILKATLTSSKFSRPDDVEVETLVRHAWGIWYGEELVEVRLRFSPQTARRVKETLWHPLQEIADLPNGGVEWRVQLAGVLELVPWIRGWGPDVEVIAPADLRERIASDAQRAASLYANRQGG